MYDYICVYAHFPCIYDSVVLNPQAGWPDSLPAEAAAWGGARRDCTESVSH